MIKSRRISSFVGWKAIRGKKLSGAAVFRAVRRGNDSARRSNVFEKHFNNRDESHEEVFLSCPP